MLVSSTSSHIIEVVIVASHHDQLYQLQMCGCVCPLAPPMSIVCLVVDPKWWVAAVLLLFFTMATASSGRIESTHKNGEIVCSWLCNTSSGALVHEQLHKANFKDTHSVELYFQLGVHILVIHTHKFLQECTVKWCIFNTNPYTNPSFILLHTVYIRTWLNVWAWWSSTYLWWWCLLHSWRHNWISHQHDLRALANTRLWLSSTNVHSCLY